MGRFITRQVLRVFNSEAGIRDWNHTLIGLIPKKDKPEEVADFRLGLGATIRLESKRIHQRPPDNILISFEYRHWIRNKKKGNEGTVALKLDMSKAYDRVEWDYLEDVMMKMRFPENAKRLIMRCVRSVSFSFLLNRSVYPFLFALCAQGLPSLFHKAAMNDRIRGVPLILRTLNITHLFFADNSLLFFQAKGTKQW
ncbi:uncharacterized protein LOC131009584 [Salvia miltiorrhiza]|uniref:uncharacterized protein LOC131009584 n=1 Tax=Salvia miltiorrhiza TaxID=226208 RepID=UPI0025AB6818|nr:uncharacterized protein LOC131009584 [Salvia miltiorrhiza]